MSTRPAHPPPSKPATFAGMAVRGLTALLLSAAIAFTPPTAATEPQGRAIFAGGCFWCVEAAFDQVNGVVKTTSGYIGGRLASPSYQQVSAGGTGHAEAVEVIYDSAQVGYQELLSTFWHNIDPVDGGGQFCDRGDQYRSAIFYIGAEQRQLAEQSKVELAKSQLLPAAIATVIAEATAFYPAEDYHQNYHQNNPARYKFYQWNCGRQQRLDTLWRGIERLPFQTR
ncbi:MAG: peptide-methionine (S)-S-oxide reductase MsrA [Porticoccaceae bacterium]